LTEIQHYKNIFLDKSNLLLSFVSMQIRNINNFAMFNFIKLQIMKKLLLVLISIFLVIGAYAQKPHHPPRPFPFDSLKPDHNKLPWDSVKPGHHKFPWDSVKPKPKPFPKDTFKPNHKPFPWDSIFHKPIHPKPPIDSIIHHHKPIPPIIDSIIHHKPFPRDSTKPWPPVPGDTTKPHFPPFPGDTTKPWPPKPFPGDSTKPWPPVPGDTTKPHFPPFPGDTTKPWPPKPFPGDSTKPWPPVPGDTTKPRPPKPNPEVTLKPDFQIIKVYLKLHSQLQVDIKSFVNTELTIQIFDLSGNQQSAFTESLVIGFNNFSLDVSGLKPGIYVVKMSDSNGFKSKQSFKFMKF
jgi:hypothetical protein